MLDHGERERLSAKARVLAEAVEQSADLREAYERQQMILRVSTAIRSELDIDAVLTIAVAEVGKAFGASRCAFYDADGMGTEIRASHTFLAPDAPQGAFPPIDAGSNPYVARIMAGQPAVVPDLHADPYFASHMGMRIIDTRSILAVPVINQGQVLGALSVHQAGRVRWWRDEEVTCFCIIADQLAMALRAAKQFAAVQTKAAELAKANEELKSLSRLKSNILANVTHELRTPLNDVITYAASVDEGVFGEIPQPAKGALAKVVDGGDKLRRLVEQMIDASLLASDSLVFHPTEVEVGMLCGSVVREMSPLAEARGLKLVLDAPPRLPNVLADPEKLERVLAHLVGNAIKFTLSGLVEVSLRPLSDGVRVEVRDTGIGIRIADQRRVFDQFYQVDQTATRQFGGTGLGLYLAARFLAAMGSSIEVDSAPGVGSTFRFCLPLAAS